MTPLEYADPVTRRHHADKARRPRKPRKPRAERPEEREAAARYRVSQAIRASAKAYARELATGMGMRVPALFTDSLEGELARRAVLLRLRRENPTIDFGTLDFLVEEELSP